MSYADTSRVSASPHFSHFQISTRVPSIRNWGFVCCSLDFRRMAGSPQRGHLSPGAAESRCSSFASRDSSASTRAGVSLIRRQTGIFSSSEFNSERTDNDRS